MAAQGGLLGKESDGVKNREKGAIRFFCMNPVSHGDENVYEKRFIGGY